MTERREFERHPIVTPVNVYSVDHRDRGGMVRNVSGDGMLFHSRSRFAIGERITVQFEIASKRQDVTGQVVRASLDTNDETLFQHLTAIQFDR